MYVFKSDPLPPNSRSVPSPADVAARIASRQGIELAAVRARQAAGSTAAPASFASMGSNIFADVQNSQAQLKATLPTGMSSSFVSSGGVMADESVDLPGSPSWGLAGLGWTNGPDLHPSAIAERAISWVKANPMIAGAAAVGALLLMNSGGGGRRY